jgi:hypothetical protein
LFSRRCSPPFPLCTRRFSLCQPFVHFLSLSLPLIHLFIHSFTSSLTHSHSLTHCIFALPSSFCSLSSLLVHSTLSLSLIPRDFNGRTGMTSYTPACSASDGQRLFVVSLTATNGTLSPSLSSNPAQTAFTRRLVLLESQPGPPSLSQVTWTVVSTYPPIESSDDNNNDNDSSSSIENDLDLLVGDFTAGTSVCQVDSVGNFVWLTSKSAAKVSDSPLTANITNVAKGVQYVVNSSGSGGAWSVVLTSRLAGTSAGTDYLWDGQVNKVNTLFSIAPGVFVHALASTQNANITLGVLTAGGSLVQSNQSWQVRKAGSAQIGLFVCFLRRKRALPRASMLKWIETSFWAFGESYLRISV